MIIATTGSQIDTKEDIFDNFRKNYRTKKAKYNMNTYKWRITVRELGKEFTDSGMITAKHSHDASAALLRYLSNKYYNAIFFNCSITLA